MTRILKPSDLVIWSTSKDNKVRTLRKLGQATTWLDRQTNKQFNDQVGNWFCRVMYDGSDPLGFMFPDDQHWLLITQGRHRGSRRYRGHLTQEQAERMALAWLDRRFQVLEEVVG